MSLRWRIMGATVVVVLLTVLASIGVGYYATQSRLSVFVDRIGQDDAAQLARNLSREYTDAGGWATVDRALSQAGYIYPGVRGREQSEDNEGKHLEGFHHDPVRVVIVGVDSRVVRDNFSELSPGTATSDLNGHRETVFDLTANQRVGQIYMDVNRDLLATESHGFLSALLYTTLLGGALDGRYRHTTGRMAVPPDHCAGDSLDRGDPGHRPRVTPPGCPSSLRTSWDG